MGQAETTEVNDFALPATSSRHAVEIRSWTCTRSENRISITKIRGNRKIGSNGTVSDEFASHSPP